MPKLTTSDYVLFAYLFFLVPLMLLGFGFARRKLFVPHHKLTMTTITIVNWFLIITVMLVTYRSGIVTQLPAGLPRLTVLVPTLHGLLGITAQVIATYLVIRMWFENQLPNWFKVQNIKRFMRFTLTLWLLTALFGLGVWVVFYREYRSGNGSGVEPGATPAATVEATPNATPEATVEATVEATKESTPAATTKATQAATAKATKPAATTQAPAATQPPATTAAPAKQPTAAPGATQEATPGATQQR